MIFVTSNFVINYARGLPKNSEEIYCDFDAFLYFSVADN